MIPPPDDQPSLQALKVGQDSQTYSQWILKIPLALLPQHGEWSRLPLELRNASGRGTKCAAGTEHNISSRSPPLQKVMSFRKSNVYELTYAGHEAFTGSTLLFNRPPVSKVPQSRKQTLEIHYERGR